MPEAELVGEVVGVVGGGVGVADGSLVRVEPAGWDHPRDAVDDRQLPGSGVHGAVVRRTGQDQVL